jgi:hypothetical protein
VIEHGKAGVNASLIVKDVMEKVLEYDPSRKPRVDENLIATHPDPTPASKT